jgi:hypothetical protein
MHYTHSTNKGPAQMNKRLAQIERRIEKIKKELTGIGEMRPGSLTRQYKDPENQSGPYYQLSYTLDMKSRTEYTQTLHKS